MQTTLLSWGHIGFDEWPVYLQDAINRSRADMVVYGNAARGQTAVSEMVYSLSLEGCLREELSGAMQVCARVGRSAALDVNASHALVDCEERVEALHSLARAEVILSRFTIWMTHVRCNVCHGAGKNSRGSICPGCDGRGWEREVKKS